MLIRNLSQSNLKVLLLFALWGGLIYSNTFSSSFHYDDNINIVMNPALHWDQLSWGNLTKIFSPMMRPVSDLTFGLNYYFGGLDVSGYHYVNISIHVLAAFGLFLFLKTLFSLPLFDEGFRERRNLIAFTASLMWLTSPVQTQAVTYIVQRMALLAAMFYFYSLYFFIKGRLITKRSRYFFYALSGLSLLLAFGSKQNAYTLPVYLLLAEIIFFRRGDLTFLLRKRVLIALSIIALLSVWILWSIYFKPQPMETSSGLWFIYWMKTRFLTGIRVIVFYLTQLLIPLPSRLCLRYDFALSRSLFVPSSTFFAVLFIGAGFFFSLLSIKKRPIFSFFTLWFLGNLTIETFHPWLILIFDHRIYLPSAGYFVFAALGYDRIAYSDAGRLVKSCAATIIVVLFLIFSINTYARNLVWKDDFTLWADVINKSPGQVDGYKGLGAAYLTVGKYEEALSNYLKAKSLEPANPKLSYILAIIYYEMGRDEDLNKELGRLGLKISEDIENNLPLSRFSSIVAKELYLQGRVETAIQIIDIALTYNSDDPGLLELREKMLSGRITYEELRQR